ncbi:MAG TPA: hypothetical protein PKX06_07355, partial [Phenylobacterium sp.]|nr:hypothetical protein [Phenylobacterium sp.]
MHSAVIAATGLYTPPQSVSNAELVEAFNTYVANFNAEHAAAIEAGEVEALTPSSVEFIEKASGIKSRFVVDKAGVIDPAKVTPSIPERSNDERSVMAEIGVAAARDAIAPARPPLVAAFDALADLAQVTAEGTNVSVQRSEDAFRT